ncbi:MAG: hypothetical protein VX541_05470, partial [Candidatus Poribacteria bacterium]|nr:hypothetical protein [Candidatus Poribacteria bacterium]
MDGICTLEIETENERLEILHREWSNNNDTQLLLQNSRRNAFVKLIEILCRAQWDVVGLRTDQYGQILLSELNYLQVASVGTLLNRSFTTAEDTSHNRTWQIDEDVLDISNDENPGSREEAFSFHARDPLSGANLPTVDTSEWEQSESFKTANDWQLQTTSMLTHEGSTTAMESTFANSSALDDAERQENNDIEFVLNDEPCDDLANRSVDADIPSGDEDGTAANPIKVSDDEEDVLTPATVSTYLSSRHNSGETVIGLISDGEPPATLAALEAAMEAMSTASDTVTTFSRIYSSPVPWQTALADAAQATNSNLADSDQDPPAVPDVEDKGNGDR